MAEFSRSQDGQFMAEHSVRGHQKRDYPVALAQSQEDSQDLGPAKADLKFLKQGWRHVPATSCKTIFYVRGQAERTGRLEYG